MCEVRMRQSGHSKGKGSRRFPGRPGGARKNKPQAWKSRATHALDDPSELGEDISELEYRGIWDKSPSERIYLLDQEFARSQIAYAAALTSIRWHPPFVIYVRRSDKDKAAEVIRQLEQNDQESPQPQLAGRKTTEEEE